MNESNEVSRALQNVAKIIDSELVKITGEHIGFSLIVFTSQRASYVSNCDRQEVVVQMQELLNHWENGMPDIPAHEVI